MQKIRPQRQPLATTGSAPESFGVPTAAAAPAAAAKASPLATPRLGFFGFLASIVSLRFLRPYLADQDLAILHSRHGTRWWVWDVVVGAIAFTDGFALSPYTDRMPAWYYFVLVGGFYGGTLALLNRLFGARHSEFRNSTYELFAGCVMATALTYLLFSLTVGLVLVRSYGRYIIVVTNAVAFAGVFLPRYWYLNLANLHPINLVLYGAGRAGNAFLTRLRECAAFRVVGFLDQQSAELPVNGGPPILGSLETVDPAQLRQQGVDVVVICVGDSLEDRNATRLLQFPLYGLDVLTMGAFSARYFREFTLDYHCPHWFTSMSSLPGNPTIFWVKRAMDLAGAITLLALTLPFWPLVALLIKLDSRGPVFFRQTRVGRFGRPFEITKFRTMEAEAEKNGAVWAQPHDPRITRLGGLLRLTRIDELPQLLNVVHGEMSIVGPRPERPEFVGELIERHPLYAQRHLVPPGLTGWAQIRFGYGATYEDAKRKLELDLYYVRHLSIAFDVEILLKTLFLVMKGSR